MQVPAGRSIYTAGVYEGEKNKESNPSNKKTTVKEKLYTANNMRIKKKIKKFNES